MSNPHMSVRHPAQAPVNFNQSPSLGTGGGLLGTVRLEELVMAPDVHGSGLLSGGKDSGRFGRCTRFSAQVPLQSQDPAYDTLNKVHLEADV